MSEFLTNLLLQKMKKNNLPNSADYEIYKYGIEVLLADVSNFIVIIIPSLFLKKIDIGILFIYVFCSIRRYSGGYHCSSNIKCNICYLLIYLFLLICMEYTELLSSKSITILFYYSTLYLIFSQIKNIDKNSLLLIINFIIVILLTIFINEMYVCVLKYSIIIIFLLKIIDKISRREGTK